MQEVRLELVPQRFLLSSADVREVSAAAEKNNWSEPDAVLVAQTITNLIYMVARWEVSSFLRAKLVFRLASRRGSRAVTARLRRLMRERAKERTNSCFAKMCSARPCAIINTASRMRG